MSHKKVTESGRIVMPLSNKPWYIMEFTVAGVLLLLLAFQIFQ